MVTWLNISLPREFSHRNVCLTVRWNAAELHLFLQRNKCLSYTGILCVSTYSVLRLPHRNA